MLDRVLFRLRQKAPDLWRLLGSWRLSIVLMVSAALYYGLLTIWATSSPPHVVQNIAGLLPFWAFYALVLVNTVLCLWRRISTLVRGVSREPALMGMSPTWEIVVENRLDEQASLRQTLRSAGFRVDKHPDGGLWGYRGRWSVLGTYLFHCSFLLLAVAVALSLAARSTTSIWIAEGETFENHPGQILSRSSARVLPMLPTIPSFTVESIRPEFWRDLLLFTELEAEVSFPDGRRAVTRINRPLWSGWGTFVRLSGFGYAPRYELVDRSGQVLESLITKMNVFPPGQRDFLRLERFPHRVYVEVIPDAVKENGQVVSRSLNLTNPVVKVQVSRGPVLVGQGDLWANETFEFEGLTFGFPEIRYWGEFSVVSDPGVPILFLSFAFASVGLILTIRGKRAEVRWVPGQEPEPGRLQGWNCPDLSETLRRSS